MSSNFRLFQVNNIKIHYKSVEAKIWGTYKIMTKKLGPCESFFFRSNRIFESNRPYIPRKP